MKSKYIYLKYDQLDKVAYFKKQLEIEIKNLIGDYLFEHDCLDEVTYCEVMPVTVQNVNYIVIRLMPHYILSMLSKKELSKLNYEIIRRLDKMKLVKETTQSSNIPNTAAIHLQIPNSQKNKTVKLIKKTIRKIDGDTK